MTEPETSDNIIRQGKPLGRAIEGLDTIEPTGPIESATPRFLPKAYECRLRGIVEVAPSWLAEQILSPSRRTDWGRRVPRTQAEQ